MRSTLKATVVGQYTRAGVDHGFLLSGGSFTTIAVPGASLTFANNINSRGDIVGRYDRAGVTHGYLLRGGQ